jgi:hypothetical protein
MAVAYGRDIYHMGSWLCSSASTPPYASVGYLSAPQPQLTPVRALFPNFGKYKPFIIRESTGKGKGVCEGKGL